MLLDDGVAQVPNVLSLVILDELKYLATVRRTCQLPVSESDRIYAIMKDVKLTYGRRPL
jgi:hypothetical protein